MQTHDDIDESSDENPRANRGDDGLGDIYAHLNATAPLVYEDVRLYLLDPPASTSENPDVGYTFVFVKATVVGVSQDYYQTKV